MTVALGFLAGCGGATERTFAMRTALDEGHPREAIRALNDELGVKADDQLPKNVAGDDALLVLDRGSIQQSVAQFSYSQRDYEAADKAIVMLDLAHDVGDDIGKYIFSDSSGPYQSPPYEKLLLNTLNMINYLEQRDLNGARVEARRLSVMQRYVVEQLHEPDQSMLGLGGFLAGLTFEKSGDPTEALRYYDEALAFSGFQSLRGPVRLLLTQSDYRTPRLKEIEADPVPESLDQAGEGELVFVIGYGRVPHKISNRIPIGLALTEFSGVIEPTNAAAANRLAAQGLVTWINFPTLGPEQGAFAVPSCQVDGQYIQLEESVNVGREVRADWHKMEGKIVASAITRMIARYAAGEGVRDVAGKGVIGELLSLGTQATLTALDTPDTRSWETLPARVTVARVRVPPGRHKIFLDARGVSRTQEVDVPKGGYALISLMALR